MQGLLSSAHIVAAFYMHSTTNNCNNPIKTILRAWLGSINGRAFFKRLDPEKVSIVKAWSFQAIRFIRTVSPSASACQASDASFIAPVRTSLRKEPQGVAKKQPQK